MENFQKKYINNPGYTELAPAHSCGPGWSPDNETIVIYSNRDICTIKSDGTNFKRLTSSSFNDIPAVFSRDGDFIYFESNRSGEYNIWEISALGGNPVQITKNGGWCPTESFDGNWLYFRKSINHRLSVVKIPVERGSENIVFQYQQGDQAPFGNYSKRDWMLFEDGIYLQE